MRRKNSANRCSICKLQPELCICDRLKKTELHSDLIILLHISEEHKTSNTAKIVAASVDRCTIYRYGAPDAVINYDEIEAKNPVVLFPHATARVLTKEYWQELDSPTLVVPDGTWGQAARQASKMAARGFKFVTIPDGDYLEYHLRHADSKKKLCTAVAIEAALRTIGEDTRALKENIELFLKLKLSLRGKLSELETI